MQRPVLFRKKEIPSYVISRSEFAYTYLCKKRDNLTTIYHTHDFYEITLISKGSCLHLINGVKTVMNAGDIIFIRASDCHLFEPVNSDGYQLHNFSFGSEVLTLLLSYLGDTYDFGDLFESELPRVVKLSESDTEFVKKKDADFFGKCEQGQKND